MPGPYNRPYNGPYTGQTQGQVYPQSGEGGFLDILKKILLGGRGGQGGQAQIGGPTGIGTPPTFPQPGGGGRYPGILQILPQILPLILASRNPIAGGAFAQSQQQNRQLQLQQQQLEQEQQQRTFENQIRLSQDKRAGEQASLQTRTTEESLAKSKSERADALITKAATNPNISEETISKGLDRIGVPEEEKRFKLDYLRQVRTGLINVKIDPNGNIRVPDIRDLPGPALIPGGEPVGPPQGPETYLTPEEFATQRRGQLQEKLIGAQIRETEAQAAERERNANAEVILNVDNLLKQSITPAERKRVLQITGYYDLMTNDERRRSMIEGKVITNQPQQVQPEYNAAQIAELRREIRRYDNEINSLNAESADIKNLTKRKSNNIKIKGLISQIDSINNILEVQGYPKENITSSVDQSSQTANDLNDPNLLPNDQQNLIHQQFMETTGRSPIDGAIGTFSDSVTGQKVFKYIIKNGRAYYYRPK